MLPIIKPRVGKARTRIDCHQGAGWAGAFTRHQFKSWAGAYRPPSVHESGSWALPIIKDKKAALPRIVNTAFPVADYYEQ